MATLDLSIQIGTTPPPVIVTCTDDAGDPFDITGATVSSKIKSKAGVLILDLAPVITDATGGLITITVTDEQTAGLTYDTNGAKWDLILELSNGEILPPIVAGDVTITNTITL